MYYESPVIFTRMIHKILYKIHRHSIHLVAFFLGNILASEKAYCQNDTIFLKINQDDSIHIQYDTSLQFNIVKNALNESVIEILNNNNDSLKFLLRIQKSKELYNSDKEDGPKDIFSWAGEQFMRRVKQEADSLVVSSKIWESDSIAIVSVSMRNGKLWYSTIAKEIQGWIISGWIINKHEIQVDEEYLDNLVKFMDTFKIQQLN